MSAAGEEFKKVMEGMTEEEMKKVMDQSEHFSKMLIVGAALASEIMQKQKIKAATTIELDFVMAFARFKMCL